jgi:hypothetical protein
MSAEPVSQRPLDITRATHAADAQHTHLDKAADEYDLWNLGHRRNVFEWQLFASKIIFWMVLSLVIAGVAFSAVQFGVSLRRRTDFADAEIAMSVEGVKIRSQFLGVITLALSLAFFYLYLKTVYPIVELPDTRTAASKQ